MERKLTQAMIARLGESETRDEIRDTVTTGLSVRTGKSGAFYYVRYSVRIHGERIRRAVKLGSTDILSLAEARERAKAILARVALGEDPMAQKEITQDSMDTWPVGRFCRKQYLPWFARERRGFQSTRRPLLEGLRYIGEDTRICDLTQSLLEEARSAQRSAGLKNCTISQREHILYRALAWGVKSKLLTVNPLKDAELARSDDATQIIRYLTKDEEARLFAALRERDAELRTNKICHWRRRFMDGAFVDAIEPMIIISLKTGIRIGALHRLVWSDFDFELKQVTVRSEICKTNRTRHIPLSPIALDTMRKWKETVKPDREDRFVFNLSGCKSRGGLEYQWRKLLKRANITNFRWHDMRHTFASNLVMAGVDLNTVRELMGHASTAMTLRYAHLAPEVKANAVSKLG